MSRASFLSLKPPRFLESDATLPTKRRVLAKSLLCVSEREFWSLSWRWNGYLLPNKPGPNENARRRLPPRSGLLSHLTGIGAR